MRIAFVVEAFPVLSETFILRQITGLMDLGHDVDIYSDREASPGPMHESVERYGLARRTVVVGKRSGVRKYASEVSVGVRLLLNQPRALRFLAKSRAAPLGGRRSLLPRLRVLAEAKPYDIVHCHFGHIGLKYRFAGPFLGIPFFVSFYGHDCSRYPQVHGEHVYAPLFRAANRVTVLGENMHERLQELGCPRNLLAIQHIGIDVNGRAADLPANRPANETVRLLSVARLVEKKGISYALHAVAQILNEMPATRRALSYEIIGDGPLKSELEALAEHLGLGGIVEFRGPARETEVRESLRKADIFIMPSVSAADGDKEGTPVVLMEAAASRLAVVSTWHSGIPEVVVDGKTGMLVAERDSGGLAEALRQLLAQPELRTEMGRAGRDHIADEYDSEKLILQLEQLYRKARE